MLLSAFKIYRIVLDAKQWAKPMQVLGLPTKVLAVPLKVLTLPC